MITQEKLKELVELDSEKGVFIRKVAISNNSKVGEVAGTACKNGYMAIGVGGERHYVHRLVWLYVHGEMPKNIDHINGIRTDNRPENLRDVTRAQNQKNQRLRSDNKSGVTGVWQSGSVWHAFIRSGGKRHHLGTFKTSEEAAAARHAANIVFDFHENHGRKL